MSALGGSKLSHFILSRDHFSDLLSLALENQNLGLKCVFFKAVLPVERGCLVRLVGLLFQIFAELLARDGVEF